MRVRDLTAEDLVGYRTMTSGAFGGSFDPSSPEAATGFSPGETALGIDASALPGGEDGVIAAGARIRHDQVVLGGGLARCGGVSGLAVHPAHRGDGLFGELLTAIIARCQAEAMPLSMLYPSNPSIYRRYGYQVVSRVESLIVPLVDLQRLRPVPGRRLVAVTERAMPRLRELYHSLSAGENALLRREPPLFPEGLPPLPWSALLLEDEDGEAHGYVSWSRRSGGEEVGIEVHELFGRTRADRQALLHSLGSWSTVTESIRLRLRSDDPIMDLLPGGGARPDPGAVPLVMMRVIDTAATLQARRAPQHLEGTVRLIIEDDTVPAGTCRAAGRFLVSTSEGTVTAHEAPQGAPPESGAARASGGGPAAAPGTARLDIHAASLLLVGGRRLADARRLGLRAEADGPAEAFLDALLAGPRPSVLDAF